MLITLPCSYHGILAVSSPPAPAASDMSYLHLDARRYSSPDNIVEVLTELTLLDLDVPCEPCEPCDMLYDVPSRRTIVGLTHSSGCTRVRPSSPLLRGARLQMPLLTLRETVAGNDATYQLTAYPADGILELCIFHATIACSSNLASDWYQQAPPARPPLLRHLRRRFPTRWPNQQLRTEDSESPAPFSSA